MLNCLETKTDLFDLLSIIVGMCRFRPSTAGGGFGIGLDLV